MKRLPVLAILVLFATSLYSQSLYLTAHPVAGFPQGDYKEYVKDFGFGFDGAFLMSLGDTPFLAGIEADAIFYDKSEATFSTPSGSVDDEPIKGTILALLVLRTQINNETFCPYVDTMFGFQHLFSESNSANGPIQGLVQDGSTFETNERGQTFTYGAALGMMVHLHEYADKKSDTSVKSLWLDCRVRYLFGSKTDYITDYNRTENGTALFNSVKGNTNLLTLQVGVGFGF